MKRVRETGIGIIAAALLVCVLIAGCDEPPKPKPQAPPMDDVTAESDLWPMFMHDRYHHGRSTVDFPSAKIEKAWTFRPGQDIWKFEPGASVWSSPVVGRIGGREVVFAGHYDRTIYALDADTGKEIWRYTVGAPAYKAPALWMQHDPPMLFVAATDRTIYGLNASDGKKLWAFECMEWNDGVVCRMSPVTIAELDGKMTVFVGAWAANARGLGGKQVGEAVALDAASGGLLWRRTLSTGPVCSPIVADIDCKRMLFVTTDDGNLHALDAATGEPAWRKVSNEFVRSAPTFAVVNGQPLVFHGTRYHSIMARDARSGRLEWNFMAGFWIDSTAAFASIDGRPMLFFGSFDRNVYGLDARTHEAAWKTETGSDICSSAAVARIAGKAAVFVHSVDNHLYGINAADGRVLWKHATGKLLWTHIDRGDSLWASPCVALVKGRPMLFHGSYDGYLYAFRCADEEKATGR